MTESINHTRLERLLLAAARTFNSTLDYEELMELVLKMIMAAVDCDSALVCRIDRQHTEMRVRYMSCGDCKMELLNLEVGAGLIGWVSQHREPVLINDAAADPRINPQIEEATGAPIKSLISVPLIGKGQMIGVLEAINKTTGNFSSEDMDILLGLSDQIAVAIDNANLYRAVKRQVLEKEALYNTGIEMSRSLDLDELLSSIMKSLRQVVDYDAGGIFVIDQESNELDSIYSIGYTYDCQARLHTKMGEGLVGHVAKTGKPVIVSDVFGDDRYVDCRSQTRSEIVTPILLDSEVIGVLNLESNNVNAYGPNDESLMKAFASQAAISLERARAHRRLLAAERIEQQLKVARDIQRTFLPRHDPEIDGYDISGRNISSGQVGGDYYDFVKIVEGQTGVAIADVVGKGIPAALIMASFRASMIAEIRNNYSIRTIMEKVNSLMVESLNPGNFVTAVYSVLDSKNHILTFSNAGHNQPIYLRRDGSVEFLEEGGPILGVDANGQYEERSLAIGAGDIVIFYTDGVTEVFSEEGREFGVKSLIELVRANKDSSSRHILESIFEAVENFAAPDHFFDDLTMIVLKRLA